MSEVGLYDEIDRLNEKLSKVIGQLALAKAETALTDAAWHTSWRLNDERRDVEIQKLVDALEQVYLARMTGQYVNLTGVVEAIRIGKELLKETAPTSLPEEKPAEIVPLPHC